MELLKEVVELVMTKVDDLDTFFNFGLVSKHFAACARKYRVQKMIKLGKIFPPLFLSHNLDKLIMRGDIALTLRQECVPRGLTYPIDRMGDFGLLTFETYGKLVIAGNLVDVPAGTYMVPFYLMPHTTIQASPCMIEFFNSCCGFASFLSSINQENALFLKFGHVTFRIKNDFCCLVNKPNVFLPRRFSGNSNFVEGLIDLGVLESVN